MFKKCKKSIKFVGNSDYAIYVLDRIYVVTIMK